MGVGEGLGVAVMVGVGVGVSVCSIVGDGVTEGMAEGEGVTVPNGFCSSITKAPMTTAILSMKNKLTIKGFVAAGVNLSTHLAIL